MHLLNGSFTYWCVLLMQKAVASNKAHEKDSISMQFSDGNKYF